jgi:hypothetical protein
MNFRARRFRGLLFCLPLFLSGFALFISFPHSRSFHLKLLASSRGRSDRSIEQRSSQPLALLANGRGHGCTRDVK